MEQASEIGGELVMEGVVGERSDFELGQLWDSGSGWGAEQLWSLFRTLDDVPYKNAIAGVNSGCDKGMNQSFSSRGGGLWAETSHVSEGEGGSSVDLTDRLFKREVANKNDSEVANIHCSINPPMSIFKNIYFVLFWPHQKPNMDKCLFCGSGWVVTTSNTKRTMKDLLWDQIRTLRFYMLDEICMDK